MSRVILACLAIALLGGCAEGSMCEELGACGGNLVGKWALSEAACQDPVYEPPKELWLFKRPVAVIASRQTEAANSSWCQNLVYTADLTQALANTPLFWTGMAKFGEARIRYAEDGLYEAGFTRTGTFGWYFSATCMRQYGTAITCEELAVPLNQSALNDGGYKDVKCHQGEEVGGCECTFEAVTVGSQKGTYKIRGNLVDHYATSTPAPISEATYCVNGNSLTLSGTRNSFLYNQVGLRTLTLQQPNCNDGLQGLGENGVDCGELCPVACPHVEQPVP